MGLTNLGNEADPVLTRIIEEDTTPWYRKKNLRALYVLLYFTCMGIEITSGFDSQMINALQIVPAWTQCRLPRPTSDLKLTDHVQISDSILSTLPVRVPISSRVPSLA